MHLPVDDVVYLSHALFLCGSLSQLRHGDPSSAADLMSLKEFLTITTTITKAAAPTTLATAATTYYPQPHNPQPNLHTSLPHYAT